MALPVPRGNFTAPLLDYGNGIASREIQIKNDDQLASGISQLLANLGELKGELKDLKLEVKELKEEIRCSDVRELKESAHRNKMDELEREMKSLKMEIEMLQDKKKEVLRPSEIVFSYDLDDATTFFEPIVKNSCRHSKVFHVGGLPWMVYVDLREEKRTKYLGFFLKSDNISDAAGTWSICASFELRLLNGSGNVIKSSRISYRYDRCIAYGLPRFVSYDELKKNGLMEKNRVKLQVHVVAYDRK